MTWICAVVHGNGHSTCDITAYRPLHNYCQRYFALATQRSSGIGHRELLCIVFSRNGTGIGVQQDIRGQVESSFWELACLMGFGASFGRYGERIYESE